MKIKLFYQRHDQTIKDFETEVNDFMATVEVVDVKVNIIVAIGGNLLHMITVLYKDDQKQTN